MSPLAGVHVALTTLPTVLGMVIWFGFGSAHAENGDHVHDGLHVREWNVKGAHPVASCCVVPFAHSITAGSVHLNDHVHAVVHVRVPQFCVPHSWVSPGVHSPPSP